MNKQQRSLLIALCGMLLVVALVILVVNLSRRGGDQTVVLDQPTLPVATDAPEPTVPPLSEEEMERQALLEEEGDEHAETAPPYEEPVD